jgi:hypothetical protein
MNLSFNLHKLIHIEIHNLTSRAHKFFINELGYFKTAKIEKADISVSYVTQITIPNKAIKLLNNFYYYNGDCYLLQDGLILFYSLKNWSMDSAKIVVEKGYPEWWVFYAIEKTLLMIISKKGYCALHAGGVANNNGAYVVSALQSGGKSLFVLNNCISEDISFLGDDIIFVNSEGNCLSYPRGINFNQFHGGHYRKARTRSILKMSKKEYVYFNISNVVKKIISICLKRNYADPLFRLQLNEVYPEVRISSSASIKHLILLSCGNTTGWSNARIVNFLIENANWELKNNIMIYLSALRALKDNYVINAIDRINDIGEKKEHILLKMLNKVVVKNEAPQL